MQSGETSISMISETQFNEKLKRVYFPINAEDNHWVLAEFHIRSGVITFYDSLPSKNLIVEDRKWWLDARQLYVDKLPNLLIQIEVMEKKNIDPSNYSISYQYDVNVPRQGKFTGDCRI
ncbi:ulp1 protease family, C-terminal catalytic domain-containing protein [Tanacetum coccineum]